MIMTEFLIRWTFNPVILKKVSVGEAPPPLKLAASEDVYAFQVGDFVKISGDRERVHRLQEGHGEWVESMVEVSLLDSILEH